MGLEVRLKCTSCCDFRVTDVVASCRFFASDGTDICHRDISILTKEYRKERFVSRKGGNVPPLAGEKGALKEKSPVVETLFRYRAGSIVTRDGRR